ncbi:hypothetical protein Dda_1558 [Drechslerella dactyloides]|uniref:Uncharacterized protein n=1 Tax=Drechslerella dactyloides TaxID=74499 RepID=A0AAD6J284_DREDA|nr:hypothetical protein Dda_1558 [Drechslerella dactyloides]
MKGLDWRQNWVTELRQQLQPQPSFRSSVGAWCQWTGGWAQLRYSTAGIAVILNRNPTTMATALLSSESYQDPVLEAEGCSAKNFNLGHTESLLGGDNARQLIAAITSVLDQRPDLELASKTSDARGSTTGDMKRQLCDVMSQMLWVANPGLAASLVGRADRVARNRWVVYQTVLRIRRDRKNRRVSVAAAGTAGATAGGNTAGNAGVAGSPAGAPGVQQGSGPVGGGAQALAANQGGPAGHLESQSAPAPQTGPAMEILDARPWERFEAVGVVYRRVDMRAEESEEAFLGTLDDYNRNLGAISRSRIELAERVVLVRRGSTSYGKQRVRRFKTGMSIPVDLTPACEGVVLPKKRARPIGELPSILQLTPENHHIHDQERYETVGDFLDNNGTIKQAAKRQCVDNLTPCSMSEAPIVRIRERPELAALISRGTTDPELIQDEVCPALPPALSPSSSTRIDAAIAKYREHMDATIARYKEYTDAKLARYREYVDAKIARSEARMDRRWGVLKEKVTDNVETLHKRESWPPLDSHHSAVSLHCFAERIREYQLYGRNNLKQFREREDPTAASLIRKCSNGEIRKEVYSVPAADVAQALLATKSQYTEAEWMLAKYQFYQKVKAKLIPAVEQGLGRGESGEGRNPRHWFEAQFHAEDFEEE